MSPIRLNVEMNGCETYIDASISNADKLSGLRKLCIRLAEPGCDPICLDEYLVASSNSSYLLIRCGEEFIQPVGNVFTLAACQILAITDYCNCNDINIIE